MVSVGTVPVPSRRRARCLSTCSQSTPSRAEGYHLFHATRAELLRRLGRVDDARRAYGAALAVVANAAERRFLEERQASLANP